MSKYPMPTNYSLCDERPEMVPLIDEVERFADSIFKANMEEGMLYRVNEPYDREKSQDLIRALIALDLMSYNPPITVNDLLLSVLTREYVVPEEST